MRNTRQLKIKTEDPVILFLIQHFSVPAQDCPWRVPGRTRPHEVQPYALGLSLQCHDKPVWWGGETGQLVEQVNIITWDNSSRKWGEAFDPPPTLQSLSQLHQSLSLRLLWCPQPQNTCLVLGGLNVRLPHFQGLSWGEKRNKWVNVCHLGTYGYSQDGKFTTRIIADMYIDSGGYLSQVWASTGLHNVGQSKYPKVSILYKYSYWWHDNGLLHHFTICVHQCS